MILAIRSLLIKNTKENCQVVEVAKTGRKYLTLTNGVKIDKSTMMSEDNFYRLFNNMEEALADNVHIALWGAFYFV